MQWSGIRGSGLQTYVAGGGTDDCGEGFSPLLSGYVNDGGLCGG